MCVWCEGAAADTLGFAVEHRPDARLAGWRWSGSHSEAVAGGLAATLAALRGRVVEEQAFAPGALVVVTLPGQGDRIDCFAGARLQADMDAPGGLEDLSVPALDYVLVNHHRSEGDAIERYGTMLDWMRAQGLVRERSRFQHREEYPLHADFARPETVRLMLPVLLPHEDAPDVTPRSAP